MVKVSLFHENREGNRFDLNYYFNNHIPLIKQKLGAECRRVEVDQGMAGADPGSKPPFIIMTHLLFDSIEAFQKAYRPHAAWVTEDRPNYTDSPPLIQISEVKN
jgi:uncharacterized protein (TIGR02118 family)